MSMTTRDRTADDQEGRDYLFVSQTEFEESRDEGKLLEWAEVYAGCYYGTPSDPVEAALQQGRLIILEIDVDGAIQVKEKMPDAYSIFVLPPSELVLLERLRGRNREDENAIQKRFAKAKREIVKAWESGAYDDFIVNRDLDKAIAEAVGLVEKARQRA